MNAGRYFGLSVLGFMTVAGLVIFIIKLASPRRYNPMMTETGGIVPYLSIIGLLAFTTGFGLVVYDQRKYQSPGLVLVGVGLLALFGSIFLNAARAKKKRAAWPVVSARCTDRKLEKITPGTDAAYWRWSVVCEIHYAGKDYRVAPKVRWSDAGRVDAPFWSEDKARQFIAQRISSNGECTLRVNPTNPLEAELLG